MKSAMLHACNAVDGTARKTFPLLGNKDRFTRLLRGNYPVLGPMGAPGIDLQQTQFPVQVRGPTTPGGQADLADVVYAIHRCTHGHGDELPRGFELIPDAARPAQVTSMEIQNGSLRLSDRVVFGLIAVAVFAQANQNERTSENCYLTFGGTLTFIINDWWGRSADFLTEISSVALPLVRLDFGDWMP